MERRSMTKGVLIITIVQPHLIILPQLFISFGRIAIESLQGVESVIKNKIQKLSTYA